MPWSDWITSPPVPWANALVKYSQNYSDSSPAFDDDAHAAIAAAYSDAVLGGSGAWVTSVYGKFGLTPGLKPAVQGDYFPTAGPRYGHVSLEQIVRWYDIAAAGDLSGARDWSPDELDALTEGVDYIGRPDRTPADDDYYIEYEAGVDSEFAGWSGTYSLSFDPSATIPTGYASAHIALATNSAPPESPSAFSSAFAATPQIEPQTGVSTLAAVTAQGSASGDFSAALEGLTAFGIATLTDGEPWPLEPNAGGSGVDSAVWVVDGGVDVTALVQFPRWRYWMPGGEIPLRLRHRGDGLGLGSNRVRNRSTAQGGNRVRATY